MRRASGQHLLDRQHQHGARARAFFSCSSVSQNTFSRHTACTATRSARPSSGMTVGDSLPGSSFAIAGSAERGACSMMYLLPLTCSTPSMRISRRRAHSCFSARHRHRRADQHRVALEHGLDLAQVIGLQRRAGRHQIADQIRAPEARRDLHRARTAPRPRRAMPRSREKAAEHVADRWSRCACPAATAAPR